MSDINGIHSCSYYCHHPKCIERQRDELRDKYVFDDAVAKEREECAKLLEALQEQQPDPALHNYYKVAANKIRERGEVK